MLGSCAPGTVTLEKCVSLQNGTWCDQLNQADSQINCSRSPSLRKGLGWEEDTGLLTLVFFLLCRRCNVEKVPCNSQLEIEGNRSGPALYSHVSKHRYPLVHKASQCIDLVFGNPLT